ncbi:MAG: DUF4124 domain-containing protein [Gammaproteobacteria bacterium]|nr:DUF4124 domain-containing protein [Gammaproteobacteria bacterium]MCP5435644.1 DUF4124 domain-containing protein [Chromatiaceae bacterium]MCW5587187.1 DUF4124 domain-containing protein [Chromatiales bacterium]MCB1818775.1 DUF4124 domain-containing protein [Gammaproteobacteria bacterium]HOP17830.1 DUF4124 domain-containing protein [Gammaproteobacteria bacterium]
MRTRCLLFLLGLAATLPAFAAKGYHLYYDENGQPVYSQFAPADGKPSETIKPPPPPAESPEVAKQRLQQQLQKFEDNREDQSLAAKEHQQREDEAQQARRRCDSARKNLEVLNGRARQLYQTSDGTVQRMSEDERQKQRAEMEKIIAADCKS